ncbi:MAG: hypothetical protein JW869_00850 [Candidatus Omnitrophica bacterium]|nr:hypothetical protein [Candidatus Omnitrophota bacterium]
MKKFLIAIGIIAVLIGGWLLFAKSLMPGAEEVIAVFHERYNQRDFKAIYEQMTSKEFKEILAYEPVFKYFGDTHDALGGVTASKKGAWGLFYENVGLIFNIEYATTFEKGQARECFKLVKRGPFWRILLYDLKENPDNP